MDERKDMQEVQQEEEGATMIEYALLVALIAILAIAAIQFLGQSISDQFSDVADKLS